MWAYLVGLRSAGAIGTVGLFVREIPLPPSPRQATERLLSVLMPLIALAQPLLVALLFPRSRSFLLRFIPTTPSVNNTAFLYIHKGLTKEAQALLENAIINRGADAITLANYGLTLGLNGKK